ncbi:MAG: HTH-type transcriptional regulator BenM [Pseudomonadota bacterium]|jgi:DNA-binding transcriptional LysR family regulator
MDLRQVRYAIAVAEELNFTRAARRCNISQPPLSRAIQELESELGIQLFERNKHSVSLTPAGLTFISEARRSLTVLEEGSDRARRVASGHSGALSIGIGGSTLYSLLPSLVRRFKATSPDIHLEFKSMSVLYQIEALRAGEIDIGLLRLPVFDEMIDSLFVHREALVVALPFGHPLLSARDPIRIDQLRDDKFITYEPSRGFNFQSDLHSLCRLANFDPEIVHEATTTETLIGIVACGEGIAIVPAAAERLRMAGVGFRPLDLHGVPQELREVRFAVAWSKANQGPTVDAFLRCAENQVGKKEDDPFGDKSTFDANA